LQEFSPAKRRCRHPPVAASTHRTRRFSLAHPPNLTRMHGDAVWLVRAGLLPADRLAVSSHSARFASETTVFTADLRAGRDVKEQRSHILDLLICSSRYPAMHMIPGNFQTGCRSGWGSLPLKGAEHRRQLGGTHGMAPGLHCRLTQETKGQALAQLPRAG